jgi:hypothetical protein
MRTTSRGGTPIPSTSTLGGYRGGTWRVPYLASASSRYGWGSSPG